MTDFNNRLLAAILDCGTDDVSIISDTTYDLFNIVERVKEDYGNITLEYLIIEIIREGIDDFTYSIKERIANIEAVYPNFNKVMGNRTDEEYEKYICELDDEGKLTYDEFCDMADILRTHKEYVALQKLNPYKDIEYSFNYLATDVCFVNNEELYQDYCKDMMEEFESNTGFSL